MKLRVFFVVFVLSILALFHKQLIGAAVKLALHMQYDCEFAYRSLNWQDNELVFTDLVLFDPTFHAHVERCTIRLCWSDFPRKLKGHLDFTGPHISFLKKREWQKTENNWLEFDNFCSRRNGGFGRSGSFFFRFLK